MLQTLPGTTHWRTVFLLAGAVLAMTGGWAQGFMVRPMLMEVYPHPGDTVERTLEFANGTTDRTISLEIIPFELGQSRDGGWQAVAVGDPPDLAKVPARSCREWITLGADTVDVPPMTRKTTTVRLQIPKGTRGFYGAGFIVRTKPPKVEARHVGIAVQFLIPLRVFIQGPSARERITLADAGMTHIPTGEKLPANTATALTVKNDGETLARLNGSIIIYSSGGKGWRRVTEVTVPERGILPGATIDLAALVGRSLPSGKYRLSGDLKVNGRPAGHLEKEISYQGDQHLTTVAVDVAMQVDPAEILLSAVPGGQRTTVLSVQNPGDDVMTITCNPAPPPELCGIGMGTIKGEDFLCAAWTRLEPAQFTLKPGERRAVQVTVALPESAPAVANYYANLQVRAAYLDGQYAGETTLPLQVKNPQQKAQPVARGIALSIAQQDGDKYTVTAQFGNVGNVQLLPTASAVLGQLPVDNPVQTVELTTAQRRILPLGTPQFTGVLDFATIKPGGYHLTAYLRYGNQLTTSKMIALKVEMDEGKKRVTVVEETPEAPR
ncbi:MAG TPA: hypothetical protein VGM23_17910 [Armatimonadota bacterium]|jgi:hypothetical protein